METTGETTTEIRSEAMLKEKTRAAGRSVTAGLFLTILKFAAGLTTGSLGLIAEAAHSALDCGAAVVTWFAVRTSWKPPDAEHHYGHGKIENLAALIETILLAATSLWIIYEAVERMGGAGPEVEPGVWAFVVIGISIVVDIVRSRDLSRVAKKSRSQALEADALHFSTDIASSAVVILGLLGVVAARKYQVPWLAAADSVAAVLVALIVLVLGWRLGKRSVDVLLDRAPAGSRQAVQSTLERLDGLQRRPAVRIRQAGDRVFADVELHIRPGLPIVEGERIAEEARRAVKDILGPGSSVLVQLRAQRPATTSIRDRVATAASMEDAQAHNITVREGTGGLHADLHLELAGGLTLRQGHAVADRVENTVMREVPELDRVDIHLDIHDETPDRTVSLDEESRLWMERRVLEIAAERVPQCRVHDVLLVRTYAGLYLSCHCTLPAETSMRDAHEIVHRLESAFQGELPELDRVSVHAEPGET